ncbi:MAG: L-lactate permease [Verrucomicrobiales bacterium]|nr:L-lactate permease [Verrucomicrobiales bacterium]
MPWSQHYDPLGNSILSTLVATLPVVVLLGSIALLRIRIHVAAVAGLIVALAVAVFVYQMPVSAAAGATLYGAAYGLFPIGWIILNLIFLYQLTVKKGLFTILRNSLAMLAPDKRVQVILIAFSFGAFFEGAAGFGTPVAVTAAVLIQLGFKPLEASGLSLIANTAPVAFGALGIPILTLASVTDLDALKLSAMVGRQLPFFSLIVPFWVVWAYVGFRGMIEVWPAALVAGIAFAIPQFLVSNFHGPWLVDIVASLVSMTAIAALLKIWRPKRLWAPEHEAAQKIAAPHGGYTRPEMLRAWLPWILLSVFVFVWGIPAVKAALNGLSQPQANIPGLHLQVLRVPPVAPPSAPPEKAVFAFNWLSATGTGILLAALVSAAFMGFSVRETWRTYWETLVRVRYSLMTIAAMLALGYVTKYSGTDATLGLAMAKTGVLYPFFGTLLGWLGVALTGSDTASNVLFGSLQKITSEQNGLSPILMGAANSSGGVMGKMVDAQSIVVASTATNWYGQEGAILRYVFFHSIALATLVGLLVFLQARVPPFTEMVVK